MERIGMSQEERDWMEWLKRARDKKMTEAAEKMGLSERRVCKLLRQMKKGGEARHIGSRCARFDFRRMAGRTHPAGAGGGGAGPSEAPL
jgi:DNA-binding Lrp family transcriptional regulator